MSICMNADTHMTNKTILSGSFLFFLILCASCEDDAPVKDKQFRPLRIEEVAYKRELVYNDAGQIVKVISESDMPDQQKITTIQEFEYAPDGKILRSVMDNERVYEYTWDRDRIIKTEEFVKGVASGRYLFSYQANGLIKEMQTFLYEQGAPKLKGKLTYAFSPDGNVSSVMEFGFQDSAFSLASIYEYDNYDNNPSVDSYFDFHTLNTGMQLHKNNPGRMVSKNKNGIAFSIEDYVYTYDDRGLAIKRETTLTFLHIGSTGSYETRYFFEEY